jgi:hypothetical protein
MKSTRFQILVTHSVDMFFERYSNTKRHENPCSGSRVVPCGPTDGLTDGWTDKTKLIHVFRNFASATVKTNFRWPILIRIWFVSSLGSVDLQPK